MISIDSPHNNQIKRTTSNYTPRMITDRNLPIPGDDIFFLNWKNKRQCVGGRNASPLVLV